MLAKHRVCRCPAFPWPHARQLSIRCVLQTLQALSDTRLTLHGHDFRDTGNPLEKDYPEPDHRNWQRRTNILEDWK